MGPHRLGWGRRHRTLRFARAFDNLRNFAAGATGVVIASDTEVGDTAIGGNSAVRACVWPRARWSASPLRLIQANADPAARREPARVDSRTERQAGSGEHLGRARGMHARFHAAHEAGRSFTGHKHFLDPGWWRYRGNRKDRYVHVRRSRGGCCGADYAGAPGVQSTRMIKDRHHEHRRPPDAGRLGRRTRWTAWVPALSTRVRRWPIRVMLFNAARPGAGFGYLRRSRVPLNAGVQTLQSTA